MTAVSARLPVTQNPDNPADIVRSMPATNPDGTNIGSSVAKGQQTVTPIVISSGQSLSAAVDLGVYRMTGIAIPATFEPTTLTFQSSYDGITYNNVYDGTGTEKSVTVAVSRRVILAPADFYGIRYIKIRGGTSGSPTTVAADRTVQLIAEA